MCGPITITITELQHFDFDSDSNDGTSCYVPPDEDRLVHPGKLITDNSTICSSKPDTSDVIWRVDSFHEEPPLRYRAPLTSDIKSANSIASSSSSTLCGSNAEVGNGEIKTSLLPTKVKKHRNLKSKLSKAISILGHPWQLAARLTS